MGETQSEIADTIKELKSSISKLSEENETPSQEEFAAARKGSEQKGPSFVTHKDGIAVLEKKLSRSQEDWKYVPQPPYPSSLLQQLYPKSYEAPNFVIFDGRKGSTREHVNRFIDALGPHAALDCYDEKEEEALVKICISNIVVDYRVYLENIGISQFSRLLEAVRKISMSVKPTGKEAWRSEETEAHQTLDEDESSSDYNSCKRKDKETYPPLPFKDEEFYAILDTMFANGAIKLPKPYKVPTREEKCDPRYCRYHQFVGHPTTACQTLRKILHA
ncbi:unnamed protein product [Prunus brigantina]